MVKSVLQAAAIRTHFSLPRTFYPLTPLGKASQPAAPVDSQLAYKLSIKKCCESPLCGLGFFCATPLFIAQGKRSLPVVSKSHPVPHPFPLPSGRPIGNLQHTC